MRVYKVPTNPVEQSMSPQVWGQEAIDLIQLL